MSPRISRLRAAVFSKWALFVLSCSAFTLARAEKIGVASFSTVLTEIAEEVGGDRVEVTALVRPGIDPHEYEPTPSALEAVSKAKLILTSGRHLERYLNKLAEATGGNADLLQVGDRLPPLAGAALVADPHWWHSVRNVEAATKLVRDELIKLDPSARLSYEMNAVATLEKLDELEKWIRRKVAELPRDRRQLVTSHYAFQYLARDYGFTISAIEGLTPETEPSNKHVAELIDQIKSAQVKAVFLESLLNPKVTREITRETGAKIGGTLYADGLGTGGAATYIGMMKHNVATIVDALK